MSYRKPHGDHCKCVECADGLAAYAPDRDAYDQALDKCRPAVLRVVTRDPVHSVETACDGSMVCQCRDCSAARARIVSKGSGNANPFRRVA